MYDVFFIAYNEPNFRKNWEILKKKFPTPMAILNVKGIHAAHKEAAKRSFTKMFWVVDGDAELVEEFDFNYEVSEYDEDNVHIWHSKNPVNDLEYGYGGIKLLPKKLVMELDESSLDMSTSISGKIKVIEKVSNITAFNTDPFNTWKSAFRECVKLSSKSLYNADPKSNQRLMTWCTKGQDRPYGYFSMRGAQLGQVYGYQNRNNPEALKKINDFDWLREKFLESEDRNSTTKKILDTTGSGMCLAKWTQTTIHLGIGQTHSCHHPKTHAIPIEEIKRNPAALHNTEFKKSIRKEMLEGKRPSECNYCWNVEDLNQEKVYSDRVFKSTDIWSLPYYTEVMEAGYEKDFDPKYLEISFSSVCNFKCSYCMPSVSSKWMEEIEKFGPYPTSRRYNSLEWEKEDGRIPILAREENPYVDAFWKWFPDIYHSLHTFRITGGEPLLDKNTFKLLDYIIANPNPEIEISVNSNFCVPENLFESFLEKVKIISNNKLVKKFLVYTSCEAHGASAEYIRYGLNYKQWLDNCYRYINSVPGNDISIMATYNALSITTFDLFLKDLRDLNNYAAEKKSAIMIDIPYLNNPAHQSVKILTKHFLPAIDKQIDYMETNKFKDSEITKLKRIKNILEEELNNPTIDTGVRRMDFAIFVDEHDKRRGTNFLETFPEMEEFYNYCKKL